MKNDTRTSDEIERDITDERAQMSDTFNDLQKKFSAEAIMNDVGSMFRDQGGEFGRTISQTVGRNPAAVALVGVGLAWLFLGQDRNLAANASAGQRDRQAGRSLNRATSPAWDDRTSREGHLEGDDPAWYADAAMARDGASRGRAAWGATEDRHDGSNGIGGSTQYGAGAAGNAPSRASGGIGHAASDLTERLSAGLESLSDEAKSRVLAARRAAHDARVSSEAAMNRGSRAATDFFEDQPLVAGALAVALGAAVGAALPHSRAEDDAMGESSDRLFAEAQAVFREERDKAMTAARSAASEVTSDIKDKGSELGESLPDGTKIGDAAFGHASEAAGRVFDSATGKTDKTARTGQELQDQGKP